MSSKPLARPPRTLSYDPSVQPSSSSSFQARSRLSQKTVPSLAPLIQSSVPALSTRLRTSVDLGSPFKPDTLGPFGAGPLSPTFLHSPRKLPISPSLGSSTPSSRPTFTQRKSIAEISLINPAQLTLLKKLCSRDHLPRGDFEWWESLLSKQKFPATNTPQDAYDLEVATVSFAIELASNNARTENFNTLLAHLLSQLRRVLAPDFTGEVPCEAYNSLFLVRVFSKHFAGNLSGDEIKRQFDGAYVPTAENSSALISTPATDQNNLAQGFSKLTIDPTVDGDSKPKSKQLLEALLDVAVVMNPNTSHSAYEFYNEILNCLLVLLSTQIHQLSSHPSEKNYFLNILLSQLNGSACDLVWKLVANFLEQKPPPAASASLMYNAYSYLFATKSTAATTAYLFPIADRSLLLILLLTSQGSLQREGGSQQEVVRHWRKGIAELTDEAVMVGSENEKKGRISFRHLYQIVCHNLQVDEICLLFNMIIVENEGFRVYVLSRTDPETLLLPLLKVLYEAVDGLPNFPVTYSLLIVLLIFSQDEVFNDNIQKVIIDKPIWFTERPLLKSVSLGGLTVLVLIRTIQYNLSHHRDIYFHTNCLATLANMAPNIQDLHQYVAQRLVNLLDLAAKRHHKVATLKGEADDGSPQESSDFAVYTDLVAFVLEIINSVLIHHLKTNLQLIYALLHKKDVFAPLREHPRFQVFVNNVENVINFFHDRIEEANQRASSAEEVLGMIELACRTWPPNRLKQIPDFGFFYEESTESAEFYVPFAWGLIFRKTFVYWDDEKAHLLNEFIYFESGESEAM